LTTLNTSLPRPVAEPGKLDLGELLRLLDEYEMRTAGAEARQRYAQPELF
jgi:hypothetical protein